MIINSYILIIIGFILLITTIGFKKYIYFISLGYGFSITVIGILLLILFHNSIDIVEIFSCILFIIYGLRLGIYLLYREIKSISYKEKMDKEIENDKNKKLSFKVILWSSCSILYFMMCSPLIYRISNGSLSNIYLYLGMLIMIFGITIEALADLQKYTFKKEYPDKFVNIGLYRKVRCPNYLGELIIWTGVLISGINSLNIYQWIISIIGYLSIVYIMFSGARRIEIRQDKTYSKSKDYRNYIRKTPIIIPFIPLYSVKKHKWLVG